MSESDSDLLRIEKEYMADKITKEQFRRKIIGLCIDHLTTIQKDILASKVPEQLEQLLQFPERIWGALLYDAILDNMADPKLLAKNKKEVE